MTPGGLASLGMTLDELHGYGFWLLIDPSTPALAAYEAMKKVYAELPSPDSLRSMPVGTFHVESVRRNQGRAPDRVDRAGR